MKKRLQGLVAGVLIGVMLTSGAVFSKQASETIGVIYDNIKILIDGKEYKPTDANGNAVEPFIYNGTTYLPVRAIANAFDKEVDWEAQTSTVTLGSKNYDWLDQMGYVDYETTGINNYIETISNETKMADDMIFDRGILFRLGSHRSSAKKNNNGEAESWQSVEYLVNSNYNEFTGTIVSRGVYHMDSLKQPAVIKIYGDQELIYTSPFINAGTKSTTFSLDISKYKVIKITADIPNFTYDERHDYYKIIGIADARLSKK